MQRFPWRAWTPQYILPTLLLLGSLAVMALIANDPDMVWIFIVAPLIAFLTAAIWLPERPWVAPLATAVLLTVALVAGALLDLVDPRGSVLTAALFTVAIVALPLTVATWLGTGIGGVYREWRDDRRWRSA